MSGHAGAADLEGLIGLRFPDGEYTISEADNDTVRWVVSGPDLPGGVAHPVFCHLATHVGKGVTFAQFAELVGSSSDAGFLFGGGSFELTQPLELGKRYLVRGGITDASSRVGARSGRFDVITTTLDLIDPDGGGTVATSIEHYICPREDPPDGG